MRSEKRGSGFGPIDRTILLAGLGIIAGFIIQLSIVAINNENELITKRRAVAQAVVTYKAAGLSYLRTDLTTNKIRLGRALDKKSMAELDFRIQGDLNRVLEMEGQIEGDIVLYFEDQKLVDTFGRLKQNFHEGLNIVNHTATEPGHIAAQEASLKPYLGTYNPLTSAVLRELRPFLVRRVLIWLSVFALLLLMCSLLTYAVVKGGTNQLQTSN